MYTKTVLFNLFFILQLAHIKYEKLIEYKNFRDLFETFKFWPELKNNIPNDRHRSLIQ